MNSTFGNASPFQFPANDAAYLAWLDAHPDGYVLTAPHNLYPDHTVIHRTSCRLIRVLPVNAKAGGFTERDYLKVYADDVPTLERWVIERRPDGKSRLCSRCASPTQPLFRVDETYTKTDIYRLVGVPAERQRGNWDTGYTQYNGVWFLFCNVGVAGRTGHDYENRFVGDELVWYGKTGSKRGQPSIESLLHPEASVYIFYREDDRAPYTFAGRADARNVQDSEPVQITWSFTQSAHERPEALPQEVAEDSVTFAEGAVKQVLVNAYERNPQARAACVRAYGFVCAVCAFDFEATFGEIGKRFIHVHHLKPVSQTGGAYELDAVRDLRPVCPNCHAMLHRRKAPFSVEELKAILHDRTGRTEDGNESEAT